MPTLDPRLLQTIAQHQDQATQAGEDFQSLPLRGFGKVLQGLENLPKTLGSKYTTSQLTESLPPPGAMGPAAPVTAAMKGFGGMLPLAVGSIGILPARVRLARAINKQGLRGPWFHGTGKRPSLLSNAPPVATAKPILTQGFDPAYTGHTTGAIRGEPAGVSLTRDPQIARSFGDILRVGVNVPPSSVGEFTDPQFQRLFKDAYGQANQKFPLPAISPDTLPPLQSMAQDLGITVEALLARMNPNIADFNNTLTQSLRKQGVEAIRYNPKRWQEFELRVLNPENAVPLGTLPPHSYTAPNPTLTRYLEGAPSVNLRDTPGGGFEMGDPVEGGFARLRQYILKHAPDFPIRLGDIVSEIGD